MMPDNAATKRTPSISTENLVYRSGETGNFFRDIRDITVPYAGKVISLFTGAGGMEIGLEQAGYETAVCSEIDADSRETLRQNRPHWRLFDNCDNRRPGDIRDISAAELLLKAGLKKGEAALVTGGAPCQPFSNMGKKLGSRDPRNGDLFLEFVKIVLGANPRGFVFENVAGIAQGRHQEIVAYMKEQFAGSGYQVAFEVLNAADYGAPQQRKRFIMLGRRDGTPYFPLPTHGVAAKHSGKFSPAPSEPPSHWITAGEALRDISDRRLSRRDNVAMNHADFMVERMRLIPPGKNFKVLPFDMLPKCWQSGKHQGQDTFGRIEAHKPAPTIRTAGYNPTKGKYIHPLENRGLSTAEMAAFQAFPESWEFHTVSGKPSIVSIGRQIGNAVPPPLARAIGCSIFDT